MLDALWQWLDEHKAKALPKSKLGQAITYALNNWEALCRYVEQGYLSIDNNLSERTLRLIAMGRNNWGVFGSVAGGETAAVLYTLTGTCKHLDIDPFAYLRELLPALLRWERSRPKSSCRHGCQTSGNVGVRRQRPPRSHRLDNPGPPSTSDEPADPADQWADPLCSLDVICLVIDDAPLLADSVCQGCCSPGAYEAGMAAGRVATSASGGGDPPHNPPVEQSRTTFNIR